MWLPLTRPQLGTWPATQACALTENQTSHPLVHSPCSIHWATPSTPGQLIFFVFCFLGQLFIVEFYFEIFSFFLFFCFFILFYFYFYFFLLLFNYSCMPWNFLEVESFKLILEKPLILWAFFICKMKCSTAPFSSDLKALVQMRAVGGLWNILKEVMHETYLILFICRSWKRSGCFVCSWSLGLLSLGLTRAMRRTWLTLKMISMMSLKRWKTQNRSQRPAHLHLQRSEVVFESYLFYFLR